MQSVRTVWVRPSVFECNSIFLSQLKHKKHRYYQNLLQFRKNQALFFFSSMPHVNSIPQPPPSPVSIPSPPSSASSSSSLPHLSSVPIPLPPLSSPISSSPPLPSSSSPSPSSPAALLSNTASYASLSSPVSTPSSNLVESPINYVPPTKDRPLFNTYHLIQTLKSNGVSEPTAISIMHALLFATHESQLAIQEHLVTKSDFSSLKVQLEERVFNASLKYDLQLKHVKEMFKSEVEAMKLDLSGQKKTIEADFAAFRADIRMNQKTDLFALQQQVARLEKEKEADQATIRSQLEQLENRLLRYFLTSVASLGALAMAAFRLLNS